MQHPVKFADRPSYEDWQTKFQGKAPITKVQDYLNTANFAQFQALAVEDLIFLCDEHEMTTNGEDSVFNFEALPLPQQIAFNAAVFALSPDADRGLSTWGIDEITQEAVTLMIAEERSTAWAHGMFTKVVSDYALVDPGLRQQLDAHFTGKGLSPPNPEAYLKALPIDQIGFMNRSKIDDWHTCFQKRPDIWKGLSPEKVVEFIEMFYLYKRTALPLEGMSLDKESSLSSLFDSSEITEEFNTDQSTWLIEFERNGLIALDDSEREQLSTIIQQAAEKSADSDSD
jgi:hypothetical protein